MRILLVPLNKFLLSNNLLLYILMAWDMFKHANLKYSDCDAIPRTITTLLQLKLIRWMWVTRSNPSLSTFTSLAQSCWHHLCSKRAKKSLSIHLSFHLFTPHIPASLDLPVGMMGPQKGYRE